MPKTVYFIVWGQLHKAKIKPFYYWQENANKIVLALKTPIFWATNIRQNVANLSIFVAHFLALVAHFGIFNENFVL